MLPISEANMFEGLFQPLHLLLIVLIVLVIFGPGKLPQVGRGLGEAIRGFKEGIQGPKKDSAPPADEKKPEGPVNGG